MWPGEMVRDRNVDLILGQRLNNRSLGSSSNDPTPLLYKARLASQAMPPRRRWSLTIKITRGILIFAGWSVRPILNRSRWQIFMFLGMRFDINEGFWFLRGW